MTHIINLDPNVLETRYSNEDLLESITELVEVEWKMEQLDRIKGLLDRLPPLEADILYLYYFLPNKKRQTDIADIFQITQAAVSYRLKRGLQRINFLLRTPEFDTEVLLEDMREIMSCEEDALIYYGMCLSSCQSVVAQDLGVNQGRVRHRYLVNLPRMGRDLLLHMRQFLTSQPSHCMEVQELESYYEELFDFLQQVDMGVRKKMAKEQDEKIMKLMGKILPYLEDLGQLDTPLYRRVQYYRFFLDLRYNFNIVHEVCLPKWSNRPKTVLV